MTELTQLLQEIQDANKCDKCGGSGETTCPRGHLEWQGQFKCDNRECEEEKICPVFQKSACPSCTGGFIVPELNETEWVKTFYGDGKTCELTRGGGNFIKHEREGGKYLPSPTLPEVLDMLPAYNNKDKRQLCDNGVRTLIGHAGEWACGYATLKYEGNKLYWDIFFSDPNPLIAALKLLLWYIKMKREGK